MPTRTGDASTSRALSDPVIRLEIFKRLHAKDLSRLALVQRAWMSPAIETKWRTCKIKLSRLLSKLAVLRAS